MPFQNEHSFTMGETVKRETLGRSSWSVSAFSEYLHRFRLQVLLPMDTRSSSRRALKPAKEQEVAEDWRQPRNETERLYRVLRGLRNKTRKRREVVLGTLFKLLVK